MVDTYISIMERLPKDLKKLVNEYSNNKLEYWRERAREIYLKYNSITLLKEVAYLELNSSDPAHYLDADQLLVLIKFTIIGSSEINSVNLSSLNLTINLFGTSDDEKKFHITVLNSNAKSEINLYQEHPSVNLQ